MGAHTHQRHPRNQAPITASSKPTPAPEVVPAAEVVPALAPAAEVVPVLAAPVPAPQAPQPAPDAPAPAPAPAPNGPPPPRDAPAPAPQAPAPAPTDPAPGPGAPAPAPADSDPAPAPRSEGPQDGSDAAVLEVNVTVHRQTPAAYKTKINVSVTESRENESTAKKRAGELIKLRRDVKRLRRMVGELDTTDDESI